MPLHEGLLLLRRLALEPVPKKCDLLLHKPTPVFLGHGIREPEDVVSNGIFAREPVVGRRAYVLAKELTDAPLELLALYTAAASRVDALQDCGI